MMTITLPIDAAEEASYTTSARERGMDVAAFVLSLLRRFAAEQRAQSSSTPSQADDDAAADAPLKSIFDMPPEEVRAEVDAALQEARRREEAARGGDLSMEGQPLPVTQTRKGDLLEVVHRLQAQAQASGLGEMTLEEINEEIAAARRERREREARQMEAA